MSNSRVQTIMNSIWHEIEIKILNYLIPVGFISEFYYVILEEILKSLRHFLFICWLAEDFDRIPILKGGRAKRRHTITDLISDRKMACK